MPDTNLDPTEPEHPSQAFNWAAYKRYRPLVVRIIDRLGGELPQSQEQMTRVVVDKGAEEADS